MSLITLKCDSSPWANRFIDGNRGNHSAGFTAGNILQLVFPTVPLPPSDPTLPPQAVPPYSLPEHSAFAFAIYLTSVSSYGRGGEEPSSAFNDRSPAYVKELSGIVLPILLRYHLFSKDGNTNTQGAPLGHLKLHQLMAPDASTLLEIPQLPPLLHSQSFYCAVSAIRSFFAKITSVPFYRTPKTLGWPTKDTALAPLPHQDQTSPSFTNLFHILQLLPNFFPPEVRTLISDFKIEESTGLSYFYSYDAFSHLKQPGIRPGTSSTNMAHPYDWPLGWDLNGFTSILEPRSFLAPLLSTHSALLSLLLDLGSHFTRALIASLLAPNGNFPGLLLATLTGIQAGHTTLCVQGIFGSGKTYSASLLLVILSSILNVNCVLTAEPNLPLATAIEIIDTLLQDASTNIRSQYARCLANQVKSSSPLDCTPEHPSQLLRHDSTLRCLLITQGSLLRDLCREHPAFQSFLASCSIAINDEAQQGGQAGSTILASFLDRRCLQLLIGDKEQTRSGTGGEPTKEALLTKLAMKSVGFLNSPFPSLPSEFVEKLAKALRPLAPFSTLLPDLPDVHCLLSLLLSHTFPSALKPATVHQAEGVTAISDVMLNLILPQSLRCPADPYFTQVATHYPHLHRQGDDGLVHYGHFEDTPTEVQDERIHRDMRNTPHHCSGYRAIHWSPSLLERSNNLQRPSLLNVVRVAAVISYFTARSIHLRKESSKLLLLAPHNDTIDDLEGLMGAAAPDYPPTLYDFYLACIYRQELLADNLDKFQFTNHQGTLITPVAQAVIVPWPFISSSLLIQHYKQPLNPAPRFLPSSTSR